jgi:hypothetical protein
LTDTPDVAAPSQDSGSFLGNLFNLYFEPAPTFAKIFAKPRILLAILLQTAISLVFTTIWLQKADLKEVARQRFEQNSRIQEMPTEQVDRMIDLQTRIMGTAFRVGPFVAPILVDIVVAGIFMFVFRFFLAADVSFNKSLATAAWSFAAMALIQTPIMLAVFWLKGDWNVTPDQIIQANPTIFFQITDMRMWLWGLLGSFDLFSAWTAFLLASGYAIAGGQKLSTCLWTVGTLLALAVALKVVLIAVFG